MRSATCWRSDCVPLERFVAVVGGSGPCGGASARPIAAMSYFRQKAGVKMISAVNTSMRPKNIDSVQIQV